MKTAKMALKIIMALTLPLNAMALGSDGNPRKELSIEERIEAQTLKLRRDQVRKELAESALTIQVLGDIADPTLMAHIRQKESEITKDAAVAALITAVLGLGVAGFGAGPKMAAVGVSAFTAAAGLITVNILRDDTVKAYNNLRERLQNESNEELARIHEEHANKLLKNADVLNNIEQQLQELK